MTDPQLLQLCNFPRREAGSFVPMITTVLTSARARGWRVKVAFIDPGFELPWLSEFERRDLPFELIASRSIRGQTAAIRRLLVGDGPAILHTHFTRWDVPAVVAARRRPDTHVVWHIHSTLPESTSGRIRVALKLALVGRSVAQVLCPAENIAAGARSRFGPKERVSFFPSGIDLAGFPPLTAETREAARIELGIRSDAVALLHFGWHWHLKGGDIFLETVKRLIDDGVENVVALERGGAERARIEAEALKIGENVKVVDPLPSLEPLFAATDVLVSSSRSEGMAYSVLEALASGLPVVASKIPGHSFLGDHIAACRVVEADPAQLAQAVRTTIERSPAAAEAERAQASIWLAENLSVEVLAERLVDLYTELLD